MYLFRYGFAIVMLLLVLVIFNIYFFYILYSEEKRPNFLNLPSEPEVFEEIQAFLNFLPNKYKTKNKKFYSIQQNLISYFNFANHHINVWDNHLWPSAESLFPIKDGAAGQIIHAIKQAPIYLADNAPKGTQLKLLLMLEGKRKLYFKPKRYGIREVISGNIYAGFDRHNSEVFAYYLAMAMNFTWVAPAAIRKIHIENDIEPVATSGLKKTMTRSSKGKCIYGKCYYCKSNETVCPDKQGELEGAVILVLEKRLNMYRHPWRRSYKYNIKMEWEKNNDYCKKVVLSVSMKRLLNLIDVSIFDYLIQNGDRHDYEVYNDRVILLDNGKGLGNPHKDEYDILAPLYQCCMLSASTWQYLQLLSGGSLTEVIKLLASIQKETLATEDHFKAVERRLQTVYATVQYCIGKQGSSKVLKLGF